MSAREGPRVSRFVGGRGRVVARAGRSASLRVEGVRTRRFGGLFRAPRRVRRVGGVGVSRAAASGVGRSRRATWRARGSASSCRADFDAVGCCAGATMASCCVRPAVGVSATRSSMGIASWRSSTARASGLASGCDRCGRPGCGGASPRRRGGDLERRAVLARASARAARDGARWLAWAATALAGGRSWRCCSHEP